MRLVDEICERLEIEPEISLAGIAALYAAWCRQVPFDNLFKLIALARDEPLPGNDPVEFFERWLETGAGGTCWAGSTALAALLEWLGFSTRRLIATMLSGDGEAPPNHGSAAVVFDGVCYAIDSSISHVEPLRLTAGEATIIDHPAYGVRAAEDESGRWRIRWRPALRRDGFDCRIESLNATSSELRARNHATRAASPFNERIVVRKIVGAGVTGVAGGRGYRIEADGKLSWCEINRDFLVDSLGLSPALVRDAMAAQR